MQGKTVINTFNNGISLDSDILNQPQDTLRDSMNGRVVFNRDGSQSWETENGSKVSIQINPNGGLDPNKYVILGAAGNDIITVLLSTDPVNGNSEIGIFSIDGQGIGSYKTLFNDLNDPNGDKLNFNVENRIEARFVFENDVCIRVYWIDGVRDNSNQPRVITFSYDSTFNDPTNVNAYTGTNLSVHSMNSQAEFNMGMIKYVQEVGGNLLSGQYQYTYRLKTKEGYRTPWYPMTRRVMVAEDIVSATNWNEYEMGGSGLVTSHGVRIQVKGIDTRYDSIEVAYLYATNQSSLNSAAVFVDTTIDGNDVLEFNHTGNIGEPVVIEELAALFAGIRGAKTLNIKDSTLYYGNLKENALASFDIEEVLSGLQMRPKIKDMRSDEWAYSGQFLPSPLPLTHGYPRTGYTELRNHNSPGGTERYEISNDYLNYKGTQVDHLYPGYFRGETYRFGIVFYDKLGFKSFAYHLGDFTFPNQTERSFNWTRIQEDGNLINGGGAFTEDFWPTNNYNEPGLQSEKVFIESNGTPDNGGNIPPMDSINPSRGLGVNTTTRAVSHLRIMGLEIDGINIAPIADQISGFKIVRTKRDATILVQGLILPTVGTNDDDDGDIICPLPSTHQNFYDFGQSTAPNGNSNPADIKLNEPFAFHGEGRNNQDRFFIRPNISVLYAPAVDFGLKSFPATQSADRITLIGGCWDEYQSQAAPSRGENEQCKYIKQYYSKNKFHVPGFSGNPYPRYNSYMESIEKYSDLSISVQEEQWDGLLTLNNSVKIKDQANDERRSHGKNRSIYMKHGNFINPTNPPTPTLAFSPIYKNDWPSRVVNDANVSNFNQTKGGFAGSFIFNYVRPNANPYGGLTPTALETSIFYTTGHFQPINNPTFDAQGMPAGLVFSGIEVFGGDCYLDYFSFLRLYPHSQWNGGKDDDYADGRVFPLELECNHTMREALGEGGSGPSLIWANVGSRNWRNLTGNNPVGAYKNGLYSNGLDENDVRTGVFEEFNLNGVLCFEELLVFFNTKPQDFKDNDRYPVRWRYTNEKLYGDPVDRWRIFEPLNFRDLNGEHGEINGSLYIFNQIYSWQTNAFGRLRASDRALIESQQGGTLTTGTGAKLDGIDYISVEHGLQHQWSLFRSDTAAYWADVNKRKLIRFAQDGKVPLTDIKGAHQWVEWEMPLFENVDSPCTNQGIHGAFDYSNNEAIWTFNRDRHISPDNNGGITLISRTVNGKTFDPYIVEQNQTAEINPGGWVQPVYLPMGNVGIGINENTLMYLFITPNNPWSAEIYNVDDTSFTPLFVAQAGSYYRLFRSSIDEPWQYEEVTANDTTPHKASISFQEYGNYFHGFHSYSPSMFFEMKHLLFANYADSNYALDNVIYAHDLGRKAEFPTFSNKSYLSIAVNENPMVAKAFDSARLNCNLDFANHVSNVIMQTETQLNYFDIASDTRKKYLEDVLRFPLRTLDQSDRTRGKHMLLTLELKNNFNHNVRITNLVTHYRVSNRI